MNKHLTQSIVLHIAMAILFIVDMPELWHRDMEIGQSPIIVDLSQVRIDELTNLPTKAEFAEEDQKATVTEHKEQYTSESETRQEPEPSKEEPEEEPIEDTKEDFVAPPEPEKKPNFYKEVELTLSEALGRKINVTKAKGKQGGVLQIEFYSDEELTELSNKLS